MKVYRTTTIIITVLMMIMVRLLIVVAENMKLNQALYRARRQVTVSVYMRTELISLLLIIPSH